jgi:hypothetical protein
MIRVRNRAGEPINENRHGVLESDAVLCDIACCLRRIPVKVDPHGSLLAPERAMLQRGEECGDHDCDGH